MRVALSDALDAQQSELWPAATDLYPELKALGLVVRITKLRCKLLSLYPQPPRPQQTNPPACITMHAR